MSDKLSKESTKKSLIVNDEKLESEDSSDEEDINSIVITDGFGG